MFSSKTPQFFRLWHISGFQRSASQMPSTFLKGVHCAKTASTPTPNGFNRSLVLGVIVGSVVSLTIEELLDYCKPPVTSDERLEMLERRIVVLKERQEVLKEALQGYAKAELQVVKVMQHHHKRLDDIENTLNALANASLAHDIRIEALEKKSENR